MSVIPTEMRIKNLFCMLVLFLLCVVRVSLCTERNTKYITIDEIKPGMEAYCLTAYKGAEIEKFKLEVLSVVRNVRPGRDAILVQGTDKRFIHTGPVAGCSGSPVYIDGRLAGALAFGWTFSKDPLYGVTPIEEMLSVGEETKNLKLKTQSPKPKTQNYGIGYVFDFSKPIDFAEIDRQITAAQFSGNNPGLIGTTLPCPLITSGLPAGVCERLDTAVRPFGLMAVAGIGGGVLSSVSRPTAFAGTSRPLQQQGATALVPGASLVVPLVTGDISMEVVGTVTEVVGDDVYGFGHSFLGYGPIDLPMATGYVHTVVSSVVRSFKFASSVDIVGALTTDESTAVRGRIGAKARMFPLTITVERYNDTEKRVYNCQLADNRLLTPIVLRAAVAGAALHRGKLPPEHTIEYKVAINTGDTEPIAFENISTSRGLDEMTAESVGPVAVLMNNPYKQVGIKSIDFNIRIVPKNVVSHIWSVDLSDSKVKAGQSIEVAVVVESFLADKKEYQCSVEIPQNLAPGKYDLLVCGSNDYKKFLREATPYRFVAQNIRTLVEAVNRLLAIKRNKLYCLLVLPPGGVAVEKAELPDLPATKTLVLQDAKRTLKLTPYSHWVEKSVETGTVVIDKKVMHITVEK